MAPTPLSPSLPLPSAPEPLSASAKRQEDRKTIIQRVQNNPLDTDWNKLAEEFGYTESYLRMLYNDSVPAQDHVRLCLASLTNTVLQDILSTTGFQCASCHRHVYSVPRLWEDKSYCDECHTQTFRSLIAERWANIHDYASRTHKTECTICGKAAMYNKEMGNRFHFDHLNMFEKTESICVMVQSGHPMPSIYKELDQCQILCTSCHRIVTEIERRGGFNRLKGRMTRDHKKEENGDEEKKEESKRVYGDFMETIYSYLRQNLRLIPPPTPPPIPTLIPPPIPTLIPLVPENAICTVADEQRNAP